MNIKKIKSLLRAFDIGNVSYFFFSLFTVSYIVFCISESNSECIATFGKSGFVKNCSQYRYFGILNLIFFFILAIGSFLKGKDGFLKNRQKNDEIDNQGQK